MGTLYKNQWQNGRKAKILPVRCINRAKKLNMFRQGSICMDVPLLIKKHRTAYEKDIVQNQQVDTCINGIYGCCILQ